MCYVCKKQIRDYSHFDQSPAGQTQQNSTRKSTISLEQGKQLKPMYFFAKKSLFSCIVCRLWDNTVERNANDVKEAAQRTLQELKASKPDLADQVRLDIPK